MRAIIPLFLLVQLSLYHGQVVPSQPFVSLNTWSESSINVAIRPPLLVGSSPVVNYTVDWDTNPGAQEIQKVVTSVQLGANEIQSITTHANHIDEIQEIKLSTTPIPEIQVITVKGATGGSFFIELDTSAYGGSLQYSGYISHAAIASGSTDGTDVESILNAMSNIYGGPVTVSRAYLPGSSIDYEYTVTFPVAMGDVPLMTVQDAQLTSSSPSFPPIVTVTTQEDGNVIRGSFRLSFEGSTTSDLYWNATAAEVQTALQTLPKMGALLVSRSLPTDQQTYAWSVTFISPQNSGYQPNIVVQESHLMSTNMNGQALIWSNVTKLVPGNEIGGDFSLSYNGQSSSSIAYNTTASDFKTILENIPGNVIPVGTIDVSRSDPDGELGYTWTVTFLNDLNRTFYGSLPYFQADTTNLSGVNANVTVVKTRDGTTQEVQELTVVTSNDISFNATAVLSFRGQSTQPITIRPTGTSCSSSITEVQTIATSTMDTTTSGGDYDISMYLQFRLKYDNLITNVIQANPNGNGNCASVGTAIRAELFALNIFDDVLVTSQTRNTGTYGFQSCLWTVNFISTMGDLNQLEVQASNPVIRSTSSYGSSVSAGDDTITVVTVTNGQKDAISHALQLLPNIGQVTVETVTANQGVNGECTWRVTFDNVAGDLPLLTSVVYDTSDALNASTTTSIQVTEIVAGTSQPIAGNFALSYDGSRTTYLPHDVTARSMQLALQQLDTIGKVDVTRSIVDPSGGYTWLVTFLTELGPLDLIVIDTTDMTGTVVSGDISKNRIGIAPPFNSGDATANIPLGSAVVTDLTASSYTITNLEQGIPYYVRVAAYNSVGKSAYALAPMPYAIPLPQLPTEPTNATLSQVDSSSLLVSFSPPLRDGGLPLNHYKIEYTTTPFIPEVQEINLYSSIVDEVQVLTSSTRHDIPEIQLIYISTSYNGTLLTEVQQVVCDASGGTFRLTFNGYTTLPIRYDATSQQIKTALEQLVNINTVTVTFTGSSTQACSSRHTNPLGGFLVSFDSVVGMTGNLPLMTAYTNSLSGLRYVDITESVQGSSPIGGTFRLSFRGFITQDIGVDVSNPATAEAAFEHALGSIDSIPVNGVSVSLVSSSALINSYDQLWRITFVSPELGGNVEALEVVQFYNALTGSDVAISVLTDGEETALERGGASQQYESVAGNEMGGHFTLTYRGHTTAPIDFDVSDTVLKSRIEALPNTGEVRVFRSDPTVWKEYTWEITFLAVPGVYPASSGDIQSLVVNTIVPTTLASTIVGDNSTISVTTTTTGTPALAGTFALTANTLNNSLPVIWTTDDIPFDATAFELEGFINALPNIGTVTATRAETPNGYTWLITFNGCKVVNGLDVCSEGNVASLQPNYSGLSTGNVTVTEKIQGSGSGYNFEYITDISSPSIDCTLTGLNPGMRYYVQIRAHNSLGYSLPALTSPNSLTPTYNPPGAPSVVRLVSSTASSITVTWDPPRYNGGTDIAGYELWLDDWAGGNPRLIYDGTDQPEVTTFTVTTSTSYSVESGKSYRFTVRALNYCVATAPTTICEGNFSTAAVYTVRAPRAPLPPPMPYRYPKSNIGTSSSGDASITIRFGATTDNGGSPITGYVVSYASPGSSTYTQVPLNLTELTIDSSNVDSLGNPLVMEYTLGGLLEGRIYRFQVAAVNSRGKSSPSPILSVVAGAPPGVDSNGVLTYSQISPSYSDVSGDKITISWPMPSSDSSGGTPITGYKLYMYTGAALNTLANPQTVFNEVQVIETNVDPEIFETQSVFFSAPTSFTLSAYGNIGNTSLSTSSSPSAISTYISQILPSQFAACTPTVSAWSNLAFTVTFTNYSGPVDLLVVSLPPASAGITSSVTSLQKGTESIRGSFTLIYNGMSTVDMPADVSAADMKANLEALPDVGVVTVDRVSKYILGSNRNAYTWTVSFNSLVGNLPLLEASSGRLGPVSSHTSISVSKLVAGTNGELVYDGTGVPYVRSYTVSDITADSSYAFQVLPINSIGLGVLSMPSKTVVATTGASAAFTTAEGSSLNKAITGFVDEIQIVTLESCQNANFSLSYDNNFAFFNESWSVTDFVRYLEMDLKTGDVIVEKDIDSANTYLNIRFLSKGDHPLIAANSFTTGCNVSVSEFLKGNANEFTILPKLASGAVFTDVFTADGFEGRDAFLVESYMNGEWYSDQGIATYHPTVYEVQQIVFSPSEVIAGSTTYLTLSDYLTPYSTTIYQSTTAISADMTPFQVQTAIQSLTNVESVDVTKTPLNGYVMFTITFLTNLGDVPLLGCSNTNIYTVELTTGVCDIQTITISSDDEFTREIQQFLISSQSTSIDISFLGSSAATLTVPFTRSDIENILNSLYDSDGSPVVTVVTESSSGSNSYSVTFVSPIGDVADLVVNEYTGSSPSSVEVVEAVKGVSPISGTFTVSYGGAYSADISYDASAIEMKTAVESLASVGTVAVTRDDTNNGFKWTISFVQNVGNLPLIDSKPYRYPVQRISTTGGSPTPLYGQLVIVFGSDSVTIPHDASALQMQRALESMPSVGAVEVSRQAFSNDQYTWLVTFRSIIDDPAPLAIDTSQLHGTNAQAAVTKVVIGDSHTLTGLNPGLAVLKKTSGQPDYTSQLFYSKPGNYTTKVKLLTNGGLFGQYYDNQWWYGQPSSEKIDSQINFDWSTNLITQISSDYVSVRWTGKFMTPKSDSFTFYLTADDTASLYFNHSLLINATGTCCIEYRAQISLEAGVYYDFVLEYQEFTGAASINLKYSTPTIKKSIVPSSYFYTTNEIVNSPYMTIVVPGAADYPYTTAYGDALTQSSCGTPSVFYVQTKDALGNNQTYNYEDYDPSDLLSVVLTASFDPTVQYFPDIEYLNNGLFKVSYSTLRAGQYQVSIKMGDHDIQCGRGETNACSPYTLTVSPGSTDASVSEYESPSAEIMDYLVEGVSGEYGYFYVQAKDTFGNNQIKGGDPFTVVFTEVNNPTIQYRGNLQDNNDGTYKVYYTIPLAGTYTVSVTLYSEPVLACVAALPPFIFSRYYDGINTYTTPSFCTTQEPQLTVVHNDFNAATSTYDDSITESLAYATVGITNSFTIQSRDTFGNLRRGDNTTHFSGYGNGKSDYFLVEFYQESTNDRVYASTAIEEIQGTLSVQTEYFRLEFGGRTTLDIPSDITAIGLKAILESLFDYQLNVTVSKTIVSSQVTWSVQFLTMLNVYQSMSSTGSSIVGQRLTLVAPSSSTSTTFYDSLTVTRPSDLGIYPVSFTLWNTGNYAVRITSDGIDIQGSPTSIQVSDAATDPTSSLVYGQGLIGGVAGETLSIQIQAKDTRLPEVQYVVLSASVIPCTQEIQSVQLSSGAAFNITFRGAQTNLIIPGATTYSQLKSELTSIGTLGSATSFSILDSSMTSLDTSSTAVSSTDSFFISFDGSQPELFGPLPLITATSGGVTVSHEVVGETPFRHEVQVIQCSNNPGFSVQFFFGSQYTANLNASTTLSELIAALSLLDYGDVSVTSPSGGSTLCSAPIFVEYTTYKGSVPALRSTDSSVTISTDSQDGALSGIYPLDGYYTFKFKGETTVPLRFDASASAVKDALDDLYSIGTVSASQDGYGVAYSYDGVTPFYGNNSLLFPIYTIDFNSVCDGTVNGVPSSGCPALLGQVPELEIDSSNIFYTPSSTVNQVKPAIIVKEAMKGYAGNNRSTFDDLDAIQLTLTEIRGSGVIAVIGSKEVQRLYCMGDGTFSLQLLNRTVNINSNYTASMLQSSLNTVDADFMSVSITSTSTQICNSTGVDTVITFDKPQGTALPLMQPINIVGDVSVDVFSVVQSVDSISIVDGQTGLYQIEYTPTKVGVYDVSVTIRNSNVATQLGTVQITPAQEYAATSTHNISQVTVQGVPQYFTVQVRDKYGNSLDRGLDSPSQVVVTMEGDSDDCQSQSSHITVPVQMTDRSPYTDGLYSFTYEPTKSGHFTTHVKLLTRGGLLGTYYKLSNLSQPLLASRGNLYTYPYHDPYWCDGLQQGNTSSSWDFGPITFCDETISDCGCDSTKLDTILSFNWGIASPLPYDDLTYGKFPNSYYSVKWTGYLSAPGTGSYTIKVYSDYGAVVTVNGVTYVNVQPMLKEYESFTISLKQDELNTIEIVYVHAKDESMFKLTWSGPGLSADSVISGDYLSYGRNIINSPITVEVYPGEVKSSTSSATGSGLTACTTLTECSFLIQARDAVGNNIFNSGSASWNVSIFGVDDWAGYGMSTSRINDFFAIDHVQYVNYTVAPQGWDYLGSGEITYGSKALHVNSDITGALKRGDTVLVNAETMMVSDTSTYYYSNGTTIIPLERPYLGDAATNIAVYKLQNCSTGTYLVTYEPYVRGKYLVYVQTPSVNEVQRVYFFSHGNLGGTYSISVTTNSYGNTVTQTTTALDLGNAYSSSSVIEQALGNLTNINSVNVNIISCDTMSCMYDITFLDLDADIPLVMINAAYVRGDAAEISVTEIVQGSSAQHTVGSPFQLNVVPTDTDARYTTAYGKGLVLGTAGEKSKFSIQSKDSYGNNRLSSQIQDIYKIHAFLPTSDFADTGSSVDGVVSYTPASSSCTGFCDGVYDVSFTPLTSGRYTIAVMYGNQLEIQNISTSWSNSASRSGYFVITYASCVAKEPCAKTKRLAWNSNGEELKSAIITTFPELGPVNVTYTQTSDLVNSAWAINFLSACDIPSLTIVDTTMPITLTTSVNGECKMIKSSSTSLPYPYSNTLLVQEEQKVSLVCLQADCTFQLRFRGYSTTTIHTQTATAATVKTALESLDSIGSVNVTQSIVSGTQTDYIVQFDPEAGSSLAHIENYGDLPLIETESVDLSLNSAVTTLTDGVSPFSTLIDPSLAGATKITVIDSLGVAGNDGLHTGIYQDVTSFIIESRDSYSNRIVTGPVSEVQIIEVIGGDSNSHSKLSGSFSVSYGGQSVDVPAGAGLTAFQYAIQQLPSIGPVTISTNSVQDATPHTVDIVKGSLTLNVTSGLNQLSSYFEVGDWIRVKNDTTGPVFSIVNVDYDNGIISLSSPYLDPTEYASVPVFYDRTRKRS